ncbi:NgoBV family restriction endonuclease [Candidatus Albibeggiatoa sp. nov. NOAA]|uniref:NgoBV family restriction endonuclease n=1 Tax=Candidatus Albibeggiatoa sp. nov. NOAA TaxID=3162724 RepID=UPI0032FDFAF2|nr:NgoBV family restriction endonuclease [Thiotrichaceae bacterium]
MYHKESVRIHKTLLVELDSLKGETTFRIGNISIQVEGKDGIGGLIEEWFGIWADKHRFNITNPKKQGSSQEFPDYYIGKDQSLLEVKTFDFSASANFDLANFESYCESVAHMPERVDSDYLIFAYRLEKSALKIENVWLKKIWEITCPSERWALKTQTKRDVIYNIRPANWYSDKTKYKTFASKQDFINALFKTQQDYTGSSYKTLYLENLSKMNKQ